MRNGRLVVYFRFLDNLRESGKVNMFGASPYLEECFGLSLEEARSVWRAWTKTFDGKTSVEDRAAKGRKELSHEG